MCFDIGAHLISGMFAPPPDTMGQTFDLLAQSGVVSTELASRLNWAVVFRSIAAYRYEAIDWHIEHGIAK